MNDKPKHRWYQFSLKTLLVGMTVLCIGPGGHVIYEQAKARKQKAAVKAIERMGGNLEYATTIPARSPMMRQVLGDETFGNVIGVSLSDTYVTDARLVHLTGLTNLKALWLENTQVTDAGLVHLAGLPKLQFLMLNNTPVGDIGLERLAELKSLTELWLIGTLVTDFGLVHLTGLPNLQGLYLADTKVTDTGLLSPTLPME